MISCETDGYASKLSSKGRSRRITWENTHSYRRRRTERRRGLGSVTFDKYRPAGMTFSDKGGQAETGTAYAERLYPSCRTRSRGQSARGLRLLRLGRTRPPRPILQSLLNWPIITAQFWAKFCKSQNKIAELSLQAAVPASGMGRHQPAKVASNR